MTALNPDFVHRGIALVKTCDACPEQYDAYDGRGHKVGYLRLRHGYFRAEDCRGDTVYEARPEGDGVFEWDERDGFLRAAIDAIKESNG
jgi:hypothetical protein